MRKILLICSGLLIVFIVLVYISTSETSSEFRTCEILVNEDLAITDFKEFDSVTVAANLLYEASLFKQFMQGKQYREAWTMPVTVPIVFLDTLKGGMEIIEEGGGNQTHSLEIQDPNGIRYSLRSLSKDPAPLVPKVAKDLQLENVVVDGISAQHPYAALVVADLAEAANILHTAPQLMFLPKQERLDTLNEKYGNRLYFLEYESEGEKNWTSITEVTEIIDTEDLIETRMEIGDKISIDHRTLIRARLFDLIIGDWDRHAKQWGWVLQKRGNELYATPLPADRDNAFFKKDGVLPTLIANNAFHPELQSFEKEITHLPGLISDFDEYFLRTATLEQFQQEAIILKGLLSDQQIEEAFRVWPSSIDLLDGDEIRAKIKARRDDIELIATDFYQILADRPMKEIVLKGSEELELTGNLKRCFDCKTDQK
ncbi:MAG: hypothetical protein HKM28_03130 [Flavobacteriaceae bacterium]|nr:hypothetical protein [Flavobacteriaceae bacterium]